MHQQLLYIYEIFILHMNDKIEVFTRQLRYPEHNPMILFYDRFCKEPWRTSKQSVSFHLT